METDFPSGGTVVVVIGSLEEAGFEVVQTDLCTSRDVCFVCKKFFHWWEDVSTTGNIDAFSKENCNISVD